MLQPIYLQICLLPLLLHCLLESITTTISRKQRSKLLRHKFWTNIVLFYRLGSEHGTVPAIRVGGASAACRSPSLHHVGSVRHLALQ